MKTGSNLARPLQETFRLLQALVPLLPEEHCIAQQRCGVRLLMLMLEFSSGEPCAVYAIIHVSTYQVHRQPALIAQINP